MYSRLAFIICRHRLETHSALKAAISYYVKKSITVDIYIDNFTNDSSIDLGRGQLYNYNINPINSRFVEKALYYVYRIVLEIDRRYKVTRFCTKKKTQRLLTLLINPSIYLFGKKFSQIRFKNYDYYIFADAYSFVPFYLNVINYAPQKAIYWNLELLDDMPFYFIKNIMSDNIKLFYSRIIQDEDRERSFNKVMGLNVKFDKIPVSILPHEKKYNKNYFKINYGIENKFILLYSGYICSWAGLVEFVKEFRKINKGYLLVIQGRTEGTGDYLDQLMEASSGAENILILPGYLDDHEHNFMIASSDAGLAIYLNQNDNDNFKYIANSSMKIATYLSHGIPVITNNLPSLKSLAAKNKGIISLDSYSGIEFILGRIKANKNKYYDISITNFNKYYNVETYIKNLYSKLGYNNQ